MTTLPLAVIAAILSAIAVVALCAGDPKRRRAAGGSSKSGMAPGRRRLLAIAACVPGIVCAALGDAAAFLMWLGGCALVGWGCAAFYPVQSGDRGVGAQN